MEMKESQNMPVQLRKMVSLLRLVLLSFLKGAAANLCTC
jgi:hypothetical protein